MSQQSPIRIVVADGHPLFTLGVRALLAREPGFEVVGDADDGEDALAVLQKHRPDVLLLDLALSGINGLEVLRRMVAMDLPTRTVIVTAAIDRADMRTALMRGAQGVLLKHLASDLLVKCVRQVMNGEYWVGRDCVGDLIDAMRNPSAREESSVLSQRERDIVSAVIKGASNKDIAWQLGLGEQTVKNHLRRIFAKLRVANRVELAVHAMEHQLTDVVEKPADLAAR
jgi:two-component system, NarL family, nitrate/nitrite response regulator NarL